MKDHQATEELLHRIKDYASEEAFAKIVEDALGLVPASELDGFKRELGKRCGRVPPSTIDRWAKGTSVPGENVRRHVLDQIRDILTGRP